jgi:GT2 family glycosyltransferase
MLNASIVVYNHKVTEIAALVKILRKSTAISDIFLIDNSPKSQSGFDRLEATYIFNDKNLGYGAAHNIALRKTIENGIPYHLVVNPDIEFEDDILYKILNYMNNNTEIGQLMPKILYPNGEIQNLCKLIPTPFDLIFRRFLPQNWTKKRMERFEMRASGYNQILNVPYLSGCFMLLRTEAIKKVGLFDERFFMYPEDIDLTRRIHKEFKTVFFPEVHVIHNHAQESYTSFRMLFIHISNMIKYFNKWGWFFDKERRMVNNEIKYVKKL